MANDPHRRLQIARRRQQVAELYRQRFSQAAIAEKVRVSQATVSADLKKIQAEWRRSSIRDFDQARELELRTVDWMQQEATEAWEKSKKPSQTATIQGEGPSAPTRKTLKNQNGDPRYLEQIQKCVAIRCDLLGLRAPQKLEHMGPAGGPITLAGVLAMTDTVPAPPPPATAPMNVLDEDAEFKRMVEDDGQAE